jgi:hypothetical protein
LFDLLRAANFLDIKSLLDLTCVKVASMIQKDIGEFQNTIDLIDTLSVEIQLEIYSHRTYGINAELADKIQAQSAALVEIDRLRTRTMARDGVRVPEDCNTLKEAVALVESVEWRGKYDNYAKTFKEKRFPTIVLGKGEHVMAVYKDEDGDDSNTLKISSAMNIVGVASQAKSEIVVVGGIKFKKGIPGNCHLQHLTVRQAKGAGVFGCSSFTMDDVLVEQCGGSGVVAHYTGVVGRCTHVEVRQCGSSGVLASSGASITLIGAKTTVHHNCTDGYSDDYGLDVYGPSSTIQLVSPLTKEQVSIDNGGGGNWGAEYGADINQIKTMDKAEFESVLEQEAISAARIEAILQNIQVTGTVTVNVPEDCDVNEAVKAVNLVNVREYFTDGRPAMIVLGKGEHVVAAYVDEEGDDNNTLEIFSAMTIVGRPNVPKSEIVVMGGIQFKKGIQGNCHLQHLTLRQAAFHGVDGYSSFTMEDVLLEECGDNGVRAVGTAVVGRCTNVEECGDNGVRAVGTGVVGRCTNVEVRQCGLSGVYARNGASIILIGAKTTVHHNCTDGESRSYGLEVYGYTSNIQLVSPLTKEQVSHDNGGGGNWGP